jgi:Type IV secretory system Conjugative DNA transfer
MYHRHSSGGGWYAYDAYAPRVFVEGAYIASSGGFISIAVAVSMSVWRAREAKTAATYGSARWTTLTEIRAAGLTAPDGVVLGRFGRDYLRHDGPEHVLCSAPTRSGKGVGLVVPTLLTWPGSCIVHDIKGENWTLTSGFEIGMPEISFGAYPQFSGPGAQMQLTSKCAAWLVLTAERIDGRTAQDWGMVNSSVPRIKLMETAERLAAKISEFQRCDLGGISKGCDRSAMERGSRVGAIATFFRNAYRMPTDRTHYLRPATPRRKRLSWCFDDAAIISRATT